MRARQFQLTLEPDPFAFGKWKPLLLQLRPQGQTCFPLCLYLFGLSPVFPFQGCRVSLCTFPNLQFPCRKNLHVVLDEVPFPGPFGALCSLMCSYPQSFHVCKSLFGRQSTQTCFSAFLSQRQFSAAWGSAVGALSLGLVAVALPLRCWVNSRRNPGGGSDKAPT